MKWQLCGSALVVLSYPDNYPVARFSDLTVTKESGTIVGTIRRFDARLVVRNSNGEIQVNTVAGRFENTSLHGFIPRNFARVFGKNRNDVETLALRRKRQPRLF